MIDSMTSNLTNRNNHIIEIWGISSIMYVWRFKMQTFGLTDAPVTTLSENTLGTIDYVLALADFIQHCQTPMTISIQGDWGSGKTSMMLMIKDKLENPKGKIETIWFNTWQFSQFQMQDEISTSLLSSFLDELQESGEKAKKSVFRLTSSFFKHATKSVADIALGGGGDAIEKIFEKLEGSGVDSCKAIKNLKNDVKEAVEEKLKKTKAERLVVFIDDLDRLMPEKAVEILEILKLFLDIHNCVFLLAVDYQVVAKGLEKKFGVSMADLKGKSFFDKIIQLPFNLPVAQYDTKKYLESLFSSGFHYNPDHFDSYTKLTATSTGFNPRNMKRLFNALKLLNMVAESRHIMDEDAKVAPAEKQRILFAILCLQTAYEPAYRILLKNLDSISDFMTQLSDSQKLKENPLFADIQLLFGDGDRNKLSKFCSFMEHFREAIQLVSDDSEDLSDSEIDNLKRFLSFSSLTSSDSSLVEESDIQGFRYKAQIFQFVENSLNSKFRSELAAMGTKYQTWFSGTRAEISFLFSLGGIEFRCCTGISDFSSVSSYLHDNEVYGSKDFTIQWFKSDFPAATINKKRRWSYQILSEHKFQPSDLSDSDEKKFNFYMAYSDKIFSSIVPKLSEFYVRKQPIVQSITAFIHVLLNCLKEVFPEAEGWLIDFTQRNPLMTWSQITISANEWANKIQIKIQASSPFFSNLMLGIHNSGNVKLRADLESAIREKFESIYGKNEPAKHWIALRSLPEEFRNSLIGRIIDDDAKYAYENSESEAKAVSHITSTMEKLKQIKDLITRAINTPV